MRSILHKVTRGGVVLRPFPHVVVDDALAEDLYAQLTSAFPPSEAIVAGREDVFAVLADGWSYSDWVVGTAHIRAVDEGWPAPGSVLHHTAGPWPFSLRDRTVSQRCEPPGLAPSEPTVGSAPTGARPEWDPGLRLLVPGPAGDRNHGARRIE